MSPGNEVDTTVKYHCTIVAVRRKKKGTIPDTHTGTAMTPQGMFRGHKSRAWGSISSKGASKMNRNVERAMLDIGKVEALMRAFENTYLDLNVSPDDYEVYNDGVLAFYALWDSIKKVGADIGRLEMDARIIDVVEAVNRSK
jgi:hypothetical protein